MRRTVLYVILATAVVAAVAGVILWRPLQARPLGEEARSAVVERGTMLVTVYASGSVEPQARADLDFEMPGRVAKVQVQVGDTVKKGDALAQLDTTRLELQVEWAETDLALAEAQLAQLQAGARPEEIAAAEADLRAAQAQVSAAAAHLDQLERGASDAQIAAAKAQVAAAEYKHIAFRNIRDVIEGDEKAKREAHYDVYVAEKELAAAQVELDRLLAGPGAEEVRQAQAEVEAAAAEQDAVEAQLELLVRGATDAQITEAKARVSQAQAALERAKLSLEHATLSAPFDGIVTTVNVTTDEMTPVGRPAVTLLDVSSFHVAVEVDEIDVGKLAEGQAAQVTLDALPDVVISGTVESISSMGASESGVVYYGVVIDLDAADVPVRADMTANATIIVEDLADVLMIPAWAVRVDPGTGQAYVYRQAGRDLERADVVLGAHYQETVQVLSGLSEGDKIVWVAESEGFSFGGRR